MSKINGSNIIAQLSLEQVEDRLLIDKLSIGRSGNACNRSRPARAMSNWSHDSVDVGVKRLDANFGVSRSSTKYGVWHINSGCEGERCHRYVRDRSTPRKHVFGAVQYGSKPVSRNDQSDVFCRCVEMLPLLYIFEYVRPPIVPIL